MGQRRWGHRLWGLRTLALPSFGLCVLIKDRYMYPGTIKQASLYAFPLRHLPKTSRVLLEQLEGTAVGEEREK